jgi:hypothetical protein
MQKSEVSEVDASSLIDGVAFIVYDVMDFYGDMSVTNYGIFATHEQAKNFASQHNNGDCLQIVQLDVNPPTVTE